MTRLRGEAGAIAPAVPVLAFVLLLLGGLVIDASRLLNARGRAVAYAEEAARAGAGAIVPGQAVLALDERAVAARVAAYCEAVLADPAQRGGVRECAYQPPLQAVSDSDPRRLVVRVLVRLELPASLLGMVGVEVLRASGEGRARPYEGVDPRDVDSSPPPVDVPVPEGPTSELPDLDVPVFPEPPVPPVPSVPPGSPAPLPSGVPAPAPSGSVPPPSPTPSPGAPP